MYHAGELIEGRFPMRRARLPFERLTTRLLGYAGARLVRTCSEAADATLSIEATGLALGQRYDLMEQLQRRRRLRFTGVRLDGRLSFDFEAGTICSARFFGAVPPPSGMSVVSRPDYREDPAFAPFEAAFTRPGSFVSALTALVGAVYGPAPLRAALNDPHPAGARSATRRHTLLRTRSYDSGS